MQRSPNRKQRFFTVRELRLSLAMIILLSFLSAVVFMYLIKVFGGSMREHSILAFVLVMVGYALVVGFLTAVFTHRFIGPFERLRFELGVILGGDFKRRLNVRAQDDAYVRAFIDDVNKVLDLLEENDRCGAEMHRDIYLELSSVINKIDSADPKMHRYKAELTLLRDKISAYLR
jgi:hypothetical protein